jgi:homoserine dehydrogenase
MQPVKVGLVGLGNVGSGTLKILTENAKQISERLGFPLQVAAVCSRTVDSREIPAEIAKYSDWRQLVNDPEVEIVAELVGGTGDAAALIEMANSLGKPVVTANKELLARRGWELFSGAQAKGSTLAMEASVAGGIPIHTVLREGIAGDQVQGLFGILNGTSNFILTEIEQKQAAFGDVLAEAQRLGYAEADPTADVEGFDARSKLAILASLAFGIQVPVDEIAVEGIRRVSPLDFAYASTLGCTIRLLCSARLEVNDQRQPSGLQMAVRPSLIPKTNILSNVRGAYNAIFVRGLYGQDTFYYGKGAGPEPTGVAVVSDLMRLARDLRLGALARVSPFAFGKIAAAKPLPTAEQVSAYYLRFRVNDQVGIIKELARILADHEISIDAILQLPGEAKADLPFVITLEPCKFSALQKALEKMSEQSFMKEAPLAMPMEISL